MVERLRYSVSPYSNHKPTLRLKLWLLYMSHSPLNPPPSLQILKTWPTFITTEMGSYAKGYDFNLKSSCTKKNCHYVHLCSNVVRVTHLLTAGKANRNDYPRSPLCYRSNYQLPLIPLAQDSTSQIDNKVPGLWKLSLSPINLDQLQYWLSLYADPFIAHELLHGFRYGYS